MSVVVTISYTNDAEVQEITKRLKGLPLKVSKVYKTDKFKRVYLRSKDPANPGRTPKKYPSA